METTEDDKPPENERPDLSLRNMPLWKKVLVFAATGFVLCGLALIPFESSSSDLSTQNVQREAGRTMPDVGNSLVGPGGTQLPGETETATAPETGGNDLSPAFLRLGFSFFVGFAIGLAFRSLLRLALIFIGLQLLVLFGLASIEWVQIDVDAMKNSFDHFTGSIGEQFGSFRDFINGSLPQASLGGMGMFAGFKKN